ncbi:MAG: type II toxin-antitoxin system Phd/YefM family antitoxin [Gemmatimonadetes bacterium]|nr:type II toxin-antitoxin system Phd/YefM family antitoxin [Gemmatimonadota bacterium]
MSGPYSVSALRANLYRLLDRVLETGRPLEVERRGKRLRIVRSERQSRLSLVRPAPGYLNVEADELLGLDWSGEWRG